MADQEEATPAPLPGPVAMSPSLPGLRIEWARTPEEMAAIFELRRRVFYEEQGIIDGRVTDGDDSRSLHAMAVIPEGVVGAGRLTPPGRGRAEAHIAWVATLPGYRRHGAGTAVMRALLAAADASGYPAVVLSAQMHALRFYERLGFVPYGDRFRVRGIEHQMMVWRRPRGDATRHPRQ